MALYKCSVCNLILEDQNPHVCPKCGATDKFEEVVEAKKIFDSERTNVLLAELVAVSEKLIEISQEGKTINLDPTCFKVFELVNDEAWNIKQLAKSEIESHVKKGKW